MIVDSLLLTPGKHDALHFGRQEIGGVPCPEGELNDVLAVLGDAGGATDAAVATMNIYISRNDSRTLPFKRLPKSLTFVVGSKPHARKTTQSVLTSSNTLTLNLGNSTWSHDVMHDALNDFGHVLDWPWPAR